MNAPYLKKKTISSANYSETKTNKPSDGEEG